VLMLLLIVPGRATFRNLSRYSDYDEKPLPVVPTGSRLGELNVAAIRAVVPAPHEQFWPSIRVSFQEWEPHRRLGRFWNGSAGRRNGAWNSMSWRG